MPQRRSYLLASIFSLLAIGAQAETLPLPENLVDLKSAQSEQFFKESSRLEAYFPLSINFVTQKTHAYCGAASIVMVLNALQVPAPSTPEYEPDYTFAQDNLVDARTEQILPRDALAKIGMTLDQIGKILAVHSVTVEVHHPNDCDFADFPPGGEHLSGSQGSLRSRELLTQDHRPGAGWRYPSVGCL